MTAVSDLFAEVDAAAAPLPPDDPMAPENSAIPAPVEVEEAEPFVPEGNGLLDRIKGFARVRKDDDKDKPARPRKPSSALTTIEPDDLATIILVPLLGLAMLAVPKHLRANDTEIAAACQPIARILLRHVKALNKVGPDFLDCALLLGITVGYFRRINQEREQATENRYPNGGMDHAPQPPQQMENTENGRSRNVVPIRTGDPVSEYLGGHVG